MHVKSFPASSTQRAIREAIVSRNPAFFGTPKLSYRPSYTSESHLLCPKIPRSVSGESRFSVLLIPTTNLPFDTKCGIPAECNHATSAAFRCHQVQSYADTHCNGMLPPSAITKGCAKSHPRRRRAVAQPRFDQDLVGVRRWRVRCGLPTNRPELGEGGGTAR